MPRFDYQCRAHLERAAPTLVTEDVLCQMLLGEINALRQALSLPLRTLDDMLQLRNLVHHATPVAAPAGEV